MQVRLAEIDDIDSLISFNQRMAKETEGKELDPQILRSGVDAVFRDERKGFYVVCDDGDSIVAGLMVTYEWSDWRNGWFWWIQSVYVEPAARRLGLYRKMYEYVKTMAADNGDVCGFRLYVENENAVAQTVYRQMGMEKTVYQMFEEKKPNPFR